MALLPEVQEVVHGAGLWICRFSCGCGYEYIFSCGCGYVDSHVDVGMSIDSHVDVGVSIDSHVDVDMLFLMCMGV